MVFRDAHGVSAHQFHTKWCRLIVATSVCSEDRVTGPQPLLRTLSGVQVLLETLGLPSSVRRAAGLGRRAHARGGGAREAPLLPPGTRMG